MRIPTIVGLPRVLFCWQTPMTANEIPCRQKVRFRVSSIIMKVMKMCLLKLKIVAETEENKVLGEDWVGGCESTIAWK